MKNRLKIFVVDDEFTIAMTLAAILKNSGFEANSFTNPLDALKAAQVNTPDLLISDVMMPGISGVDLAIHMRTLYPNCKILLFSGQAATTDLLQGARKSGYDFTLLQKPIHPTDLLNAIQNIVPNVT